MERYCRTATPLARSREHAAKEGGKSGFQGAGVGGREALSGSKSVHFSSSFVKKFKLCPPGKNVDHASVFFQFWPKGVRRRGSARDGFQVKHR